MPPTLRDLAEALQKLIDLVRPSNIEMSGIITASNSVAITVPNSGSSSQNNSASNTNEPLTESEAIDAGLSVIQQPIGVVPIYRTTLSGTVDTDIEYDETTYSSQTQINLNIRWDGQFNTTDQFTVESGIVTLFQGQAAIQFVVDPAVGASYGKIWNNNNGTIRLSGKVVFADPISNTIMFGDERIISFPIELVNGNELMVNTDGYISTSYMKPFRPTTVSDYNGDGVVDGADETLFLSDFQNSIAWADVVGDGVLDQADVDRFYSEFTADQDHQNWVNARMGN